MLFVTILRGRSLGAFRWETILPLGLTNQYQLQIKAPQFLDFYIYRRLNETNNAHYQKKNFRYS